MESNYFETLRKNKLTKDQVEVRIADVSRNGFTLVVYKTRNADKNILDKIVGPENWQKSIQLLHRNLGSGKKDVDSQG